MKADGSRSVQVIPSLMPPQARPEGADLLTETVLDTTVRHHLSFYGRRVTPEVGVEGADHPSTATPSSALSTSWTAG